MTAMEVLALALLVATELNIKLIGVGMDPATNQYVFAGEEQWCTMFFLQRKTPEKLRGWFIQEFTKVFCNVLPSPVSSNVDDGGN